MLLLHVYRFTRYLTFVVHLSCTLFILYYSFTMHNFLTIAGCYVMSASIRISRYNFFYQNLSVSICLNSNCDRVPIKLWNINKAFGLSLVEVTTLLFRSRVRQWAEHYTCDSFHKKGATRTTCGDRRALECAKCLYFGLHILVVWIWLGCRNRRSGRLVSNTLFCIVKPTSSCVMWSGIT